MSQDEERYPCATLDEALPELRRPPAPGAVKFKIQHTAGDYAQIVPYIDVRLVYDRLDQVCGGNWSAAFSPLPTELVPERAPGDDEPPPLYVRCRLTVCGVTREDVGDGEDPKAAFSDAAKRAAVHFGIARAIYALRAPWLEEGDADSELRRNRRGKLVVDTRTDAWCRHQYERWLEDRGIQRFGEPLDHGDDQRVAAAQPSPERPAAAPAEAEAESPRTTGGGLRAVTNGDPGEPPATPTERRTLNERIERSPYTRETVSALAELLHDQGMLDRLSREQADDVGLLVEVAERAAITETAMKGQLTKLAKRPDRQAAAAWLRQRLIERANERQLLDRRAA